MGTLNRQGEWVDQGGNIGMVGMLNRVGVVPGTSSRRLKDDCNTIIRRTNSGSCLPTSDSVCSCILASLMVGRVGMLGRVGMVGTGVRLPGASSLRLKEECTPGSTLSGIFMRFSMVPSGNCTTK